MRNKLLSMTIVVMSAASVAYASFSSNLSVTGTGTATGNWDVEIISITPTAQTGATDHVSTPSFTATSATFNVDLAYPGATSSYQVMIKNLGNITVKPSSITELTSINNAAPTYLTYAISGMTLNSTLAPNATVTATVSVSWASSASINLSGASKGAVIAFNYIQN